MDISNLSDLFREQLTPAQRATPLNHTIDPGFVNHRLIETLIGPQNMDVVNQRIRGLPPNLPDWLKKTEIGHIYALVLLVVCNKTEVPSLGQIIAGERGHLFCSTERLSPCPTVYKRERVVSRCMPAIPSKWRVELHYSTTHICSDTVRSQLRKGDRLSIVAELHSARDGVLVFHPLLIGNPWLEQVDANPSFDIMWYGRCFFENFIEDFDEFSQVKDIPMPASPEPMQAIAEHAFKMCLHRMLGDAVANDWGGESSDFYTAHMRLGGHRLTGAFLLKGPARFAPMGLRHLGKNNDQIVRLSHEPADVLFVQHCHDILPPVRETLRAFAVQPSNPRRYCLIDGRDSLRLLQAYDLYDWAVHLSKKV